MNDEKGYSINVDLFCALSFDGDSIEAAKLTQKIVVSLLESYFEITDKLGTVEVRTSLNPEESSRENNTVSFDDGDYKVCSCGRLNRLENDRCIRCDKPLDG